MFLILVQIQLLIQRLLSHQYHRSLFVMWFETDPKLLYHQYQNCGLLLPENYLKKFKNKLIKAGYTKYL